MPRSQNQEHRRGRSVRAGSGTADQALRSDEYETAFRHLERAHVLAQHMTGRHTFIDWRMMVAGLRRGDVGEVLGKVRAGLVIPYGDVPRDDVAATLLEIIERPAVNRIIIKLNQGNTPVAESVQRLARLNRARTW